MFDIQFVSSTTQMISHLKNTHFLTVVEHKKSKDNNLDQYNDNDDENIIVTIEIILLVITKTSCLKFTF